MNIRQLLTFSLGLAVGFSLFIFANTNSGFRLDANKQKIVESDVQYVADFSNDKVLVGASHNIFIGKVVQSLGSKDLGNGPETQYSVEVIDNIKGNLQGNVTVDQEGGYVNGILYVIGDDASLPQKDDTNYLLQPGATYLLATRYNQKENWYTLNSYPTASKLLSSDSTMDYGQLKTLAEQDQRVQQLKVAYPNEILLDADVQHNNALNSYKSLSVRTIDVQYASSTDALANPAQ